MDQLIRELALARFNEEKARQHLDSLKAEIQAEHGQELGRLTALLDMAEQETEAAEAATRGAALDEYDRTGQKQVHPAILVKIYKVLHYTESEAVLYCRQHLPAALKLNKKVFEKAAAAIPMDFVITYEEPRPTISRDLSQYLDK